LQYGALPGQPVNMEVFYPAQLQLFGTGAMLVFHCYADGGLEEVEYLLQAAQVRNYDGRAFRRKRKPVYQQRSVAGYSGRIMVTRAVC
jgi:hypothetical protein